MPARSAGAGGPSASSAGGPPVPVPVLRPGRPPSLAGRPPAAGRWCRRCVSPGCAASRCTSWTASRLAARAEQSRQVLNHGAIAALHSSQRPDADSVIASGRSSVIRVAQASSTSGGVLAGQARDVGERAEQGLGVAGRRGGLLVVLDRALDRHRLQHRLGQDRQPDRRAAARPWPAPASGCGAAGCSRSGRLISRHTVQRSPAAPSGPLSSGSRACTRTIRLGDVVGGHRLVAGGGAGPRHPAGERLGQVDRLEGAEVVELGAQPRRALGQVAHRVAAGDLGTGHEQSGVRLEPGDPGEDAGLAVPGEPVAPGAAGDLGGLPGAQRTALDAVELGGLGEQHRRRGHVDAVADDVGGDQDLELAAW